MPPVRSTARRLALLALFVGLPVALQSVLGIGPVAPIGPIAPAGAAATGTVTDGSPEAIVVVGASGVIASWWGGGGARWTCRYLPIDAPFIDPTGGARSADGVDPVEGMAYVFNCDDEAGRLVSSRFVVYTPADPFGGVAVEVRVVLEARRRLPLDPPLPRANPAGVQLVGLPTWLWVEGDWSERRATAAVGSVSATVHAVPVGVDWDTGDGGHLLCDRGLPYDPTRAARSQASTCTHVFQRSSATLPERAYRVRATLRWVAWWTASTGAGGSLGILSTAATLSLPAVEAQALVR